MKRIVLSIDGMTCSACSNGLMKYLNKQEGIIDSIVNLVLNNATIDYDEEILNIEKIEKYIKEAGFVSLGEFKEIKKNINKLEIYKLIIFSILALLLMYVTMGHMLNLPMIPYINYKYTNNYIIFLIIMSLLFFIYGFDIIKSGILNLIHKMPNMDSLVTIGVLVNFLYSLYNVFSKNGVMSLYFESSAIIIYFIKLGRFIDNISKDKTKDAIRDLVSITPEVAYKKVGKEIKEITIDMVKKGDILVSKVGSKIAVDGIIVKGSAHFDESFITGESLPVKKAIKDKVVAGSINYDGLVYYEAVNIGKDSTISNIVKLVMSSINTKAPISRLADKISGYFVPSIFIIGIVSFIVYLILGFSFSESLITLVTVLLVACPCALGLATPLAVVESAGICAKKGILIKKSELLETVKDIDTILFDKTGTLTYGNLSIYKVFNFSDLSNNQILSKIATVENESNHPIKNAFTNYVKEENIKDFKNLDGIGVYAKIDKEDIYIGNNKLFNLLNIKNNYTKEEKELTNEECSIVYLIINKKVYALIGVKDILKENVLDVIKELKKENIKPIIITGDNEKTASLIAKSIEIDDVIANVMPSEKADTVNSLLKKRKKVMMVGDGINDAPALALASASVSFKNSTPIATNTADIILMNNNLQSIITLINISKKTIKIIKENLFWAFFYNILMIPIAVGLLKPFGIYINPIIASIAMTLSSLCVILNTLRLKFIIK